MTHKLHKPYDALLRSIDFFSQNLHLEQITQYGFKLFMDLIQPDQALLYLKNDQTYTVKYASGQIDVPPSIPYADKHREFAVLSGFILEHRSSMEKYFDAHLLDALSVEYIMPLISGNDLMGFIFYRGSNMVPKPDVAFMTRFNHMLNLSLEKACRYLDQKELEVEVNKRMFNLAFLSQTTKLLLSEHKVEKIHTLCIDVVRELTSSSITSILTPDPTSGHLITRAYKDILDFEKRVFELKLHNFSCKPQKVVYHIQKDYADLEDLFINADHLIDMKAEYVVLLITDSIIGVITIGKPIGAIKYDSKILEQIENVAGIMHLALTNAGQIDEILSQRNFMERQANLLKKVNKSVKTINSSESVDELCQVTMDTLQFAFGVEAGFIATFKGDFVELKAPLGFSNPSFEPICQSQLKLQVNDEMLISYVKPELGDYFCDSILPSLPDSNCLIIAPIRTSSWQPKPLGCIVVLRTVQALREEQTILIENLSNSIAPVIKQFNQIDKMKENYQMKPELAVNHLFNKYENDKVDFGIEFSVQIKPIHHMPFEAFDPSPYTGLDYVRLSNFIIVFTDSQFPLDESFTVYHPQSFEELVTNIQELHMADQSHSGQKAYPS